jgi:hypothetical protein
MRGFAPMCSIAHDAVLLGRNEMARLCVVIVASLGLLAPSLFADQNHDVAIANCDWIEAAVAKLNNVIPAGSALDANWNQGRDYLNATAAYRDGTSLSTWSSRTGTHAVEAAYRGSGPESIELERRDGKHITVDLYRMDVKSQSRIPKIRRMQQELVLRAYEIYGFMLGAEDPSDPRWTFINPLPTRPPKSLLNDSGLNDRVTRTWDQRDGSKFDGIFQWKIGISGKPPAYLFTLPDGSEKQINQPDLSPDSKSIAEWELDVRSRNKAELKQFKLWLPRVDDAKKQIAQLENITRWKVSDEFRMSREAMAETRRWIEAKPITERERYEKALKWLQSIGEMYAQGDSANIKQWLADPARDFVYADSLRRKVSDVSWKGDVEQLLGYTAAGKIYVRDGGGPGVPLRLEEVWKKSTELAFAK